MTTRQLGELLGPVLAGSALHIILMAITANLTFTPLWIIASLFLLVKNDLQSGPEGLGYLMSCFGLRSLVGMLLLGPGRKLSPRARS